MMPACRCKRILLDSMSGFPSVSRRSRAFPLSKKATHEEVGMTSTGLNLEKLEAAGIIAPNRRDFIRVCTLALAAVGLPYAAAAEAAKAIATKKLKPSVIWLHFQECTGCTESLLRTSHPAVSELILDLVSLDYCETLFAAAGHQAEAALKTAMTQNAGKYVLVIEGAIPTKDNGIYCQIGGRTALDI